MSSNLTSVRRPTGRSRFNSWRRNTGQRKAQQCDWRYQLPAPVWRHHVTWWCHVEHQTDRYKNGDTHGVARLVWSRCSTSDDVLVQQICAVACSQHFARVAAVREQQQKWRLAL